MPNAAHWPTSGPAWGLAPLQARVQPRAHGLGATRTRHNQGATGAPLVGTRPPQQAHAGQLRAGRWITGAATGQGTTTGAPQWGWRWITGASASTGRHRPGTTTPARAAPRAHGPAGARHYLVQAPGSATHYRHTAVAPLQVAAVGSARAQRWGRAPPGAGWAHHLLRTPQAPSLAPQASHCRGQAHHHRACTGHQPGTTQPAQAPRNSTAGARIGPG